MNGKELNEMIDFIREQLPDEELLAQLAEECNELAQAALKMRRVLDGKNPTPVKLTVAYDNLVEEIGDVKLVLRVLGYHMDDPGYDIAVERKLRRWTDRLHQAAASGIWEDKTESGLLEE